MNDYKIKNKKVYIIIFLLVLFFYFIQKLMGIANGQVALLKYIAIIYLSFLSFFIFYYLYKQKELSVEKKFLLIAVFFGIFFILMTPLMQGIDEGAHFYKIYSYFTKDNQLPKIIYKAHIEYKNFGAFEYIGKKVSFEDTMDPEVFRGANLYTWLSYLPYIIPMFFTAVVFKLDFYSIAIIGRLFGFITYLVVSTYAIKIMPDRKKFMAAFCLMPAILTSVTAFSADLCTNLPVILFIALWYRLYKEERKITKKELLLFCVLGIIMACSKIVYALIMLILFLLPAEKFGNSKNKRILIGIILGSILAVTIVNLLIIGSSMVNSYPKIEKQKNFIVTHPFKYLLIFVLSVIKNWDFIFRFTTNHTILHNIYFPSEIISYIYFMILLISLFDDDGGIKLNNKSRNLIIVIIFLIVFVLYTSLYVQWTAEFDGVENSIINGMQARYYIPIALMMCFIPTKKSKINLDFMWYGIVLVNYIVLMNIVILVF